MQKEVAEKSAYEVVWLKNLAEELQGEGMSMHSMSSAELARCNLWFLP